MSNYVIGIQNADGTTSPVSTATPLPTSGITAGGVLSTENSTVANLAGAAVFTGTSVDWSAYGSMTITAYSSHASATNGLSIQQSMDNTNWFVTDTYTVAATTKTSINVPRQARYLRVVYTNGGTLTTTLQIQTFLNYFQSRPVSARPGDAMTIENDFDQAISIQTTYNGTTADLQRSIANGTNSTGTGIMSAGIMAQFDDVSVTSITENNFGNLRMSQDHVLYVTNAPTSALGTALAPVATTVAAGSVVLKASAGNVYSVNAVSGASAGYVMLFNATSAPADGTVTPAHVWYLPANSSLEHVFVVPLRMTTGATLVFSTTGPFTKTISATAFLAGQAA